MYDGLLFGLSIHLFIKSLVFHEQAYHPTQSCNHSDPLSCLARQVPRDITYAPNPIRNTNSADWGDSLDALDRMFFSEL